MFDVGDRRVDTLRRRRLVDCLERLVNGEPIFGSEEIDPLSDHPVLFCQLWQLIIGTPSPLHGLTENEKEKRLAEHGLCCDRLYQMRDTIDRAGKEAFRRAVQDGDYDQIDILSENLSADPISMNGVEKFAENRTPQHLYELLVTLRKAVQHNAYTVVDVAGDERPCTLIDDVAAAELLVDVGCEIGGLKGLQSEEEIRDKMHVDMVFSGGAGWNGNRADGGTGGGARDGGGGGSDHGKFEVDVADAFWCILDRIGKVYAEVFEDASRFTTQDKLGRRFLDELTGGDEQEPIMHLFLTAVLSFCESRGHGCYLSCLSNLSESVGAFMHGLTTTDTSLRSYCVEVRDLCFRSHIQKAQSVEIAHLTACIEQRLSDATERVRSLKRKKNHSPVMRDLQMPKQRTWFSQHMPDQGHSTATADGAVATMNDIFIATLRVIFNEVFMAEDIMRLIELVVRPALFRIPRLDRSMLCSDALCLQVVTCFVERVMDDIVVDGTKYLIEIAVERVQKRYDDYFAWCILWRVVGTVQNVLGAIIRKVLSDTPSFAAISQLLPVKRGRQLPSMVSLGETGPSYRGPNGRRGSRFNPSKAVSKAAGIDLWRPIAAGLIKERVDRVEGMLKGILGNAMTEIVCKSVTTIIVEEYDPRDYELSAPPTNIISHMFQELCEFLGNVAAAGRDYSSDPNWKAFARSVMFVTLCCLDEYMDGELAGATKGKVLPNGYARRRMTAYVSPV